MKRLLSTTTVLSLALAPIQPWPLLAQGAELTVAEDGSILAPDGTLLCASTPALACDLEVMTQQVADGLTEELKAQAAAVTAAQAAKVAEDAAAAEAAVAAEAAAAAQAAEAEAAAQAAAAADDAAAAAAEATAAAETAAAEAAAATAAAESAAAADAAAAAEAEAAAAAAATALAEELRAAEDAAAASDAAAAEAAKAAEDAAAAAALQAADDAAAAAEAAKLAEDAAAAEAAAQAEAAPEAEAPAAPVETAAPEVVAPEVAAPEAVAPEAVAQTPADPFVAPVAEPVAEAEPVDIPVVTEEESQSLIDLLAAPTTSDGSDNPFTSAAAAAAALGLVSGQTPPGAATDGTAPVENTQAPAVQPEPESVTVTTVTEDSTRSSAQEFAAAPTAVGSTKKSGLSDLEKVGLLALGALVVGKMLSDGRQVVENTGDRVVVRNPDGGYAVYKDDDTLLRRPGATVRTETYRDGSTRSTVDRTDGTQVVTIRDASGRVLRRATYDARGNELILIDDLAREERIDVSTLPRPRADRVTISTNDGDAALKAALAREEARRLGRTFSLRQIREIPQVRALAATIDVDNITFDSGSAVIRPTEARKLAAIGGIMEDILRDNPGEVFLIEGHTDAVGAASYNLTLSDRRAESVALALTEYYGIPPENMVVQGYGESELRIETQADERRNRRAVLRVVTPLMRTADLR